MLMLVEKEEVKACRGRRVAGEVRSAEMEVMGEHRRTATELMLRRGSVRGAERAMALIDIILKNYLAETGVGRTKRGKGFVAGN